MTIDEAKEILEEIKINDDCLTQYIAGFDEALDMAIKLLEQEPILDKIRTEIEKEIDRDDHADEYCDGYYDGMRNALAIIDKHTSGKEEV